MQSMQRSKEEIDANNTQVTVHCFMHTRAAYCSGPSICDTRHSSQGGCQRFCEREEPEKAAKCCHWSGKIYHGMFGQCCKGYNEGNLQSKLEENTGYPSIQGYTAGRCYYGHPDM